MGHSSKPDCQYNFAEFASDIRHLIKTLNVKNMTLVGWSIGVSVTLEYMSHYQAEQDVSSIVLINGPVKLIRSDDWGFGIEKQECMDYIEGFVREPIVGRRKFAEANLLNP